MAGNLEKSFMLIRAATQDDVPGVTRCVTEAYSVYIPRLGKVPGPMLESYSDVIATRSVFIAEESEGIIGVLVVAKDDEGFLLENLAVDPRHQGKGIGKVLLQYAEDEARRRGFSEIHLYTNVVMAESEALYRKIGYVEYDRRMEKGFSRIYIKKILA